MSQRFVAFTLTLAAALAGAARAEAPARDPVAAEALFLEGREAFKTGDYAAACPKFAESYRLDPAAGALFNLADCWERAGRLATAWQRWQELADLLRSTPTDERLGVARKHVADLEPRLPRLRVHWDREPVAGAVVRRDGVKIRAASLGSALPTDPGPHRIEVTAPHRSPRSFDVVAKGGTTVEVAIDVGDPAEGDGATAPAAATANADPAGDEKGPPRGGTSGLTIGGAVVLGLGAAALIAAGATGLVALSDKNTVNAECDASKVCSQKGYDAASQGHTMATVSTVTSIAGGVLAALGIVLVAVGVTQQHHHASVVPLLDPHGAGLALQGSF